MEDRLKATSDIGLEPLRHFELFLKYLNHHLAQETRRKRLLWMVLLSLVELLKSQHFQLADNLLPYSQCLLF